MRRKFCIIGGLIILVSSLLGIFVPIMGFYNFLTGWSNIFGTGNLFETPVGDLTIFRFDLSNIIYGFIPGVCVILGAFLHIISKKGTCLFGSGFVIFGILVLCFDMNLFLLFILILVAFLLVISNRGKKAKIALIIIGFLILCFSALFDPVRNIGIGGILIILGEILSFMGALLEPK